ncbi:MAG: flavodoxin family protein [Coriobacteriales bacterium]|jgi:multimeric flavodoxin WrbA|nr:flavodoxin family protein [Coriobacteriales bacterium]
MEVLLLNGSPNEKRCTYTALSQVAAGLEENGVGAHIHWLGAEPVKPCIGCGACGRTGRCAFGATDGVNALIEKAQATDGLVLGSPVFFAGINGSLKSTLDRLFFAASSRLAFKPGACIVSARRAGTTAALEQLNKYINYAQMPQVGSFYWPMVHGQAVEHVLQDEEGMQIAYQLGANMAWLLKCLEAGAAAGIRPTQPDKRARTNFIQPSVG